MIQAKTTFCRFIPFALLLFSGFSCSKSQYSATVPHVFVLDYKHRKIRLEVSLPDSSWKIVASKEGRKIGTGVTIFYAISENRVIDLVIDSSDGEYYNYIQGIPIRHAYRNWKCSSSSLEFNLESSASQFEGISDAFDIEGESTRLIVTGNFLISEADACNLVSSLSVIWE
ncbi:MAG: hypothetical protein JJ974_03935 [Phycisphaerales bacterium]|nr:hypothetical protein [Phycisphaerales bacterium]